MANTQMSKRLTMMVWAALMVVLQLTSTTAQDGPAEFSSAPCSSLALGPSEDVSHLERTYLFQGSVHALVPTILAWLASLDPLWPHAELYPPYRQRAYPVAA